MVTKTTSSAFSIPSKLDNIIGAAELAPKSGQYFAKLNPHDGTRICEVARSNAFDVQLAVNAAQKAQAAWADTPPIKRGDVLFEIVTRMKAQSQDIAAIVALETGKSMKDALGETAAAIAQGQFMAGEGMRLYGRTAVSGVAGRYPVIVREPVGIAGLIGAANTPIANVAWKTFPALICGNAAVLKSAEDTPLTAWIFAKIALEAGLPPGVLSVVHGIGAEAGAALVEHPEVPLVSFTGSTAVGKRIARQATDRLAKVSLELGGKNPLVVCDDADLENAVKWAVLSAFSNAGQRCASASRIIVFEKVYDRFKELFAEKARALKVGPDDADDFGPVINERQLTNMLGALERAIKEGAQVVIGANRLMTERHKRGFYMEPTILENVPMSAEISRTELFGPITCLYRAADLASALKLANDSPYGLTASIHTRDFNRAALFTRKVQAGVAVVNAGTHGSEPHMPFGGVKDSGNGTREPGLEALDIYCNLKVITQNVDQSLL